MSEGEKPLDSVRAKEFVLLGDEGNIRALLTAYESDATVLNMYDKRGLVRLSLQVDIDGSPSVCLYTSDQAPGVSFVLNEERGNGFMVADTKGIPRFEIAVPNPETGPAGTTPRISIHDYHGYKLVLAPGKEIDKD